jgi:hypothetical protein
MATVLVRTANTEVEHTRTLHDAWTRFRRNGNLSEFVRVGRAISSLRSYMRVVGVRKWFEQNAPPAFTMSLANDAEWLAQNWDVVEHHGIERVGTIRNALRLISMAGRRRGRAPRPRSNSGDSQLFTDARRHRNSQR